MTTNSNDILYYFPDKDVIENKINTFYEDNDYFNEKGIVKNLILLCQIYFADKILCCSSK